jgi:ubiquinone/menaquinone biosynthesis C-methylase UbiE
VQVQREYCFNLSFEDAHFDTVLMANLLHVIPDPSEALHEARRVLKPGGKILVLSLTSHGMGFLSKMGLIRRYLKTFGKPPEHNRTLKKEDVVHMLSEGGFRVEQLELVGNKTKAIFAIARRQ